MEEEVKELFQAQLIDVKDYQMALLILRHEAQIEREKEKRDEGTMEQWLVGVDLGGTTVKLAFVNMYGEIICKWEIPTDKSEQGKHITTHIAKAIDESCAN